MTATPTEIYEALETRIDALLPDHARLPHVYDVANNNEDFLEKGWGMAVRSGEPTNREICGRRSFRRTYEILISRKYFALDHDVTRKSTTEKNLLEDMALVYADFCENFAISTEKGIVQGIGDNGIEPVFAAEKPFYIVRINATVEYF